MKNLCNNDHQCCNSLLESIALEEAGIAHILNAEGEKIQNAVKNNLPFEQMLKINNSVACVISEVTNLELALINKIKAFACMPPCPSPCPHPCPHPCPPPCPKERCIVVYVYNSLTCQPICNANVKILHCNKVVFCGNTNELGLFKACGLQNGCYNIFVNALCKEKCGSVRINDCDTETTYKTSFSFYN